MLIPKHSIGFEVAIEHPHPHVVKCMNLVKSKLSLLPQMCGGITPPFLLPPRPPHMHTASRDLSQTAYFMAHNRCFVPVCSLLVCFVPVCSLLVCVFDTVEHIWMCMCLGVDVFSVTFMFRAGGGVQFNTLWYHTLCC